MLYSSKTNVDSEVCKIAVSKVRPNGLDPGISDSLILDRIKQ